MTHEVLWSEEELRVEKQHRTLKIKKLPNYVSLETLTLRINPITLQQISVNLPVQYITGLDLLVEQKVYANRAEAIRFAVQDLLRNGHSRTWKELWRIENGGSK